MLKDLYIIRIEKPTDIVEDVMNRLNIPLTELVCVTDNTKLDNAEPELSVIREWAKAYFPIVNIMIPLGNRSNPRRQAFSATIDGYAAILTVQYPLIRDLPRIQP
jgi:hypothetical protein